MHLMHPFSLNIYSVFLLCSIGLLAAMALELWTNHTERNFYFNYFNFWFGIAFAIIAIFAALWMSWVQTDSMMRLFSTPESEGIERRTALIISVIIYLEILGLGICIVGFLAAMALKQWFTKPERNPFFNIWFGLAFAGVAVLAMLWGAKIQVENMLSLFSASEMEGIQFQVVLIVFVVIYFAIMVACLWAGVRGVVQSSLNTWRRYLRLAPVLFIVALMAQQLYAIYKVVQKALG